MFRQNFSGAVSLTKSLVKRLIGSHSDPPFSDMVECDFSSFETTNLIGFLLGV